MLGLPRTPASERDSPGLEWSGLSLEQSESLALPVERSTRDPEQARGFGIVAVGDNQGFLDRASFERFQVQDGGLALRARTEFARGPESRIPGLGRLSAHPRGPEPDAGR